MLAHKKAVYGVEYKAGYSVIVSVCRGPCARGIYRQGRVYSLRTFAISFTMKRLGSKMYGKTG